MADATIIRDIDTLRDDLLYAQHYDSRSTNNVNCLHAAEEYQL